jgi:Zinc finger, C2H2 type
VESFTLARYLNCNYYIYNKIIIKKFIFKECGKNFKKKSLLDLHMHVHRKKTIQCDVCKMLFTFVTGLNKHKKLGRCKGPPQATLKDSLSKEDIAIIAKKQLMEITVNPKKEDIDCSISQHEFVKEISSNSNEISNKRKKPAKIITRPSIKNKATITVRTLTEQEIKKQQDPVITSSSGRIIKKKLPPISIQYITPSSSSSSSAAAAAAVSVQKKTFVCDTCGISKSSKAALLAHFEFHNLEDKYACSQCDSSFGNILCMKNHSVEEHQNENYAKEKKYECDICHKRYTSNHFLALHKKSHENLREHKCSAEGCNFDTNSPYDLKNHFKRVHEAERRFPCADCNKVFKRRCDMNNHRQAIHTDCRIYVKCPVCAKIILEKGLQSHIINSHKKAEVKPFVCKFCGKAERYEKNLQRHIDAVHEPKDRGN